MYERTCKYGVPISQYCPQCAGDTMDSSATRSVLTNGAHEADECTCDQCRRSRFNADISRAPRLPEDSKARKDIPMYSGLLAYFPLALAAVAKHSKESNDKHNPGEPLHWSREKSSDHMDCIIRHAADYSVGDQQALVAVVWRGLAQLQLDEEARLAAGDGGSHGER